ncbi:MAG TPA: hypothetical protein VL134_09920 [Leptolyngbya sp.]|nr:hypothetical protein [Leptolyngbya sp.]
MDRSVPGRNLYAMVQKMRGGRRNLALFRLAERENLSQRSWFLPGQTLF